MSAPASSVSSSACLPPNPAGVRWVIAALYQFRAVAQPEQLRSDLLTLCQRLNLCGTLIVAAEGLNGTLAGSEAAVAALHAALESRGFRDLEFKTSRSETAPFRRLKVRLKREIVTLGAAVSPRERVGHYIEPQHWNALIADPDVLLIDTRNRYEVKAGSFAGALDPQLENFREFPAWAAERLPQQRGRKIAMFCTGGIRCEKSTSWLLDQGYEDVYHLKGGILGYLEQVPQEESRWQGECFVFDGRVTVGHELKVGGQEACLSCGWPLISAETQHLHYERGVSCPHCWSQTSEAQKERFRERQRWYDRSARSSAQKSSAQR